MYWEGGGRGVGGRRARGMCLNHPNVSDNYCHREAGPGEADIATPAGDGCGSAAYVVYSAPTSRCDRIQYEGSAGARKRGTLNGEGGPTLAGPG